MNILDQLKKIVEDAYNSGYEDGLNGEDDLEKEIETKQSSLKELYKNLTQDEE